MPTPFKPIKPKRVSDQVFDQLRELIFRGQLKPGEQLMPERDLAEVLNVSRTTIRNAINKLVVLGLLDHRQGQGTFVKSAVPVDTNPLALAMEEQDASLEDLLEVRMGLECNAAALAAKRADENDIQFLMNSLNEMTTEIKAGRLGTEADTTFHMAIAYATKNPVQIFIMRKFYDFLFVGIRENLRHLYEDPVNIEKIIKQHSKLVDCIRQHDAEAAFEAMHYHISFVLNFFRDRI
jgi:GntR family transcriptional repressor for pyruvate dehydrogenase complex